MSEIGKKMRWHHDAVALVFCFLILAVAVLIGHFHKVGDFGVETDFYSIYIPQAENIVAGRPYTYQHNPPGYMVLLAGVTWLTHDHFTSGKIITAAATGLFGWITYLLIRALFGRRLALATVTLLLISLIPFSFVAATDMVGALSTVLPLWILLRRPVLRLRVCFWAGVFAGVAYLIRYQMIFVIVGISLSLLFLKFRRATKLQERVLSIVIFLCGVFLIISPWLVINWKTNGTPFASTAHFQIAAHFYHPLGDVTVSPGAFKFKSLFDVVLHDPAKLFKQYLNDVLLNYPERLFILGLGFPAYLFAGAGILFLLSGLTRRRLALLAACLLGYLLLGLVGFYIRYYLFLFPLLFLFVCYFLFHKSVSQTRLHFALGWSLLIILAAIQAHSVRYEVRQLLSSEPIYLLEIGKFLRERSSSEDIIFAERPHYAYFARLKSAYQADQSPDDYRENAADYLARAEQAGARYLVYSQDEARRWPGTKALANPDSAPGGLTLIYQHEATNTLIYEITGIQSKRRM